MTVESDSSSAGLSDS